MALHTLKLKTIGLCCELEVVWKDVLVDVGFAFLIQLITCIYLFWPVARGEKICFIVLYIRQRFLLSMNALLYILFQ